MAPEKARVPAALWRRAGLSLLGMLLVATGLMAAEGVTPTRLWSAWTRGQDTAADPRRPWDAAYFPNPVLTTQDGTRVRFYDDLIKGKTVAINTFFSVCTDVCPLSTAKMLELQRRLGDRVGRDIFFYSLSVDPEHDTPASMKEYAQRYGVGPGWLFLTGKAEDIQRISQRMGLGMLQAESPRDAHSTTLMVGHEPSGQWMKHSSTDNPQFVAAMLGTFFGWKADADAPDYRQAGALQITSGEFLFRNGCAACHSIGEGDRIGPDLKDVAKRRDPVWLERFVREPDVLIDRGDPLAQELLQRHKGVRMPNLGLKPDEVAEILGYIAARSAKVAEAQVAHAPAAH